MGPLALAALGAGVGLAKSELVDRQNEARQRQMQGEIARFSPWSGMSAHPEQIKSADPFGSALQYGMTGGMMGMANPGAFGGEEAAAPAAEPMSSTQYMGAGNNGYPMSVEPSRSAWMQMSDEDKLAAFLNKNKR